MDINSPLSTFTITQFELGSPLIWEPAVGTVEHERLVDAYIPGTASIQQKRAIIAVDFFDTTAVSTMPAPFCRTYLVAVPPVSYSPVFTPTASISTPSSSFSVSSTSLASKSSKRSLSSISSSASSAAPAKRLPGFSIMTKDGVDITNNQSRGPKSKEQREQAAKMRKLGACPACKRSKQKCDPLHHRPTPMSASASSSTNVSSSSASSSPWQGSNAYASASESPGSRASISPQSSFGSSFSPAAPRRQTPVVHATANSFALPATNDSIPGAWGYATDMRLLSQNCNPLSFDITGVNASFDEDFVVPRDGIPVFGDESWFTQDHVFDRGVWYDDFVLSSYINNEGSNELLHSVPSSSSRSPTSSSSTSTLADSSHVPGALEQERIYQSWPQHGQQDDSRRVLDGHPDGDGSQAATSRWSVHDESLVMPETLYSRRDPGLVTTTAATKSQSHAPLHDGDGDGFADQGLSDGRESPGRSVAQQQPPGSVGYTARSQHRLRKRRPIVAPAETTSVLQRQTEPPSATALFQGTAHDEVFHKKRSRLSPYSHFFSPSNARGGLASAISTAIRRDDTMSSQSLHENSSSDIATSAHVNEWICGSSAQHMLSSSLSSRSSRTHLRPSGANTSATSTDTSMSPTALQPTRGFRVVQLPSSPPPLPPPSLSLPASPTTTANASVSSSSGIHGYMVRDKSGKITAGSRPAAIHATAVVAHHKCNCCNYAAKTSTSTSCSASVHRVESRQSTNLLRGVRGVIRRGLMRLLGGSAVGGDGDARVDDGMDGLVRGMGRMGVV